MGPSHYHYHIPPIPSLAPANPLQGSEARLFTFSQETKDHLRKFRLGTSRASDPQAVICMYVSRQSTPLSPTNPFPPPLQRRKQQS